MTDPTPTPREAAAQYLRDHFLGDGDHALTLIEDAGFTIARATTPGDDRGRELAEVGKIARTVDTIRHMIRTSPNVTDKAGASLDRRLADVQRRVEALAAPAETVSESIGHQDIAAPAETVAGDAGLAEATDNLVGGIARHLGEECTLTDALRDFPDDGPEWAAVSELHALAEAAQRAMPDDDEPDRVAATPPAPEGEAEPRHLPSPEKVRTLLDTIEAVWVALPADYPRGGRPLGEIVHQLATERDDLLAAWPTASPPAPGEGQGGTEGGEAVEVDGQLWRPNDCACRSGSACPVPFVHFPPAPAGPQAEGAGETLTRVEALQLGVDSYDYDLLTSTGRLALPRAVAMWAAGVRANEARLAELRASSGAGDEAASGGEGS